MNEKNQKIIKVLSFIISIVIILSLLLGCIGGISYLIDKLSNKKIKQVSASTVVGNSTYNKNSVICAINFTYYIDGSVDDNNLPLPYSFCTPFIFTYDYDQDILTLRYVSYVNYKYVNIDIPLTFFFARLELLSLDNYNLEYFTTPAVFRRVPNPDYPDYNPYDLISIRTVLRGHTIAFTFEYTNTSVDMELAFDDNIRLVSDYFDVKYYLSLSYDYYLEKYLDDYIRDNIFDYYNNWLSGVKIEAYNNATSQFDIDYADTYSFKNFFSSIFDIQFDFFGSLITFDFFGYDFANFYKFLIGLSLIIILLRILI